MSLSPTCQLRAGFYAVAICLIVCMTSRLAASGMPQLSPDGKLEFEAASVRPDDSEQQEPASFPLTVDDSYPGAATLFHADFTLDTYIAFAYKIWETPSLRQALLAGQPQWVGEQRYRIQARLPENATKDQIRQMMQSLLADRFGLRAHFEKREEPVLALKLAKSGVLGPKLRRHEDGPACSQSPAPGSDVFPLMCGDTQMKSNGPLAVVRARNVTLDRLASFLGTYGSLNGEFGREVIDETGLRGEYDYTIEFARQSTSDNADSGSGPSLLEALHDQLGMKLSPTRAQMMRLVIDHVERPSVD